MNQRKIEVKLIRHLIQATFDDSNKTCNIDDCLSGKLKDDDIVSLDWALLTIKHMKYDYQSVMKLYDSIVPSLKKELVDRNIIKRFITEFDIMSFEDLFAKVIEKNLFGDLTFCMAVLIYNHFYFSKHKTFLVFYYKCVPHIRGIMQLREEETHFFTNLYKANQTYHIKKNLPSFENLKAKLLDIFDETHNLLGLTRIGVFGSYGRGDNNEYSDIDILIEIDFKTNLQVVYPTLSDILSREFGQYVDLKLNHSGKEPAGFLVNCYKYVKWFN